MLVRLKHLAGTSMGDPAYLRARACLFRQSAGDASDWIIHDELLRLADVYEELATDAEIEGQVSTAHHA
jgi:hypothetical protein